MKPEKQSQRSEDREFSASASSKRTDLGFCALTIVFVRAFGPLTGGYPGFYGGPGSRGRLLGNDDSQVTGKSLDPQDHRHVVWPSQPWRCCMVPSRLSVDEDATRAENFPSLVLDPLRKVCGQGCTAGGQTVVVISPVSNFAVISTYDRDSSYRNRNPSGESSVDRYHQIASAR